MGDDSEGDTVSQPHMALGEVRPEIAGSWDKVGQNLKLKEPSAPATFPARCQIHWQAAKDSHSQAPRGNTWHSGKEGTWGRVGLTWEALVLSSSLISTLNTVVRDLALPPTLGFISPNPFSNILGTRPIFQTESLIWHCLPLLAGNIWIR